MDINTCFVTTAPYRDLALYSHLIPALATVILAVFAYWRAVDRQKGAYFLSFSLAFALWLLCDMLIWTRDSYHLIAALWVPMDLIEISFFLLLFGFICTDLFPAGRPKWLDPLMLLGALIALYSTLHDPLSMQQPVCEMTENTFLAQYKLWLEALILVATLSIGGLRIAQATEKNERIRIALIVLPVFLFLGIFAGTEYYATTTGIFEVNLYSFFLLPVFILFLTISITSFGTFRLGDAAVKTLFYVFLALAGTQFFSVEDLFDFALTCISFGVMLTLGIMLFRSNEREITARHKIEAQEKDLEVAKAQQENLLHFISHEIKGYLTKGEAAFAAIVEDAQEPVPAPVRTLAGSALAEMRKGVATVMDILDASNLKKGTVAFKKEPLDFKALVEKVAAEQRPIAEQKGLGFDVQVAQGGYRMTGDAEKLREHVVRNLVDNAIKYTPKGTVTISLSDGDKKIHFAVQDNGVGITPEDMERLFTEGGHGKDSIKVNVHSTGYGLFIAKQIVDAHGGKIWAESDGEGKGSKFTVELPAAGS